MARGRVRQLEAEVEQLRSLIPVEAFQGRVATSPFAESQSRSILPWRRHEVIEAASSVAPPARAGYLADVPIGGTTEWNQGYTQIGGVSDRRTFMQQLQLLYITCPWSAAAVDTIARFCSAGGMDIVPDVDSHERLEKVDLTPQAQKAQDLFAYVNPEQNFRQLMRGIFTDLLIYGDSFVEVVWALGEPLALYSLPCTDMLVVADEHGVVSKYVQRTETNRKAVFEPHEVIHIKLDSPRGGLYGLGPTEKTLHAIVTWTATEGLLKKTMLRGNPPRLAVAHSPNAGPNEKKRWRQQFMTRFLGPANVGNPVEFEGNVTDQVRELSQNPIVEYIAVKNNCRDEICGGYGTPPAILSIIESGNLGGGTGTSQFKTFRVNTCGPLEELVLEAFTFAILEQGFKVKGMRCSFEQIDWRDDELIEKIRTMRVSRGAWTINRYRDDIGEPALEQGGDDAVIIQTRDVVLVKDLAQMSKAQIEKDEGPTAPPPGVPQIPGDAGEIKPQTLAPGASKPAKADGQAPKHAAKTPRGAQEAIAEALAEAFRADVAERRARALRELTEAQP